MKTILTVIFAAAVLPAFVPAVQAQNLEEIFRKVSPSVVVVRAKGRDVGATGVTHFTETGSGVLISDSGRVMTAAHVVNGMDEITVEGIGGEVVHATIVSANAAADVSLLQLERVTKAMRVATVGDSDAVSVGQQIMIVGAPYGLAYSMSVGWISARWAPNTIFRDMPLAEFFQTTATINSGNSVDDIPADSESNVEKIRTRLADAPAGTPFKMNVLRADKVIALQGAAQ